jgi:hypothetical protein
MGGRRVWVCRQILCPPKTLKDTKKLIFVSEDFDFDSLASFGVFGGQGFSSGRPGHAPSAKDVTMQVRHGLAAIATVVNDEAIPGFP